MRKTIAADGASGKGNVTKPLLLKTKKLVASFRKIGLTRLLPRGFISHYDINL